jgi:hypothetical protein
VLTRHVQQVDEGFAAAIDKLNSLLAGIQDNTEDLGDKVGELRATLMPQAAE